MHSLFPNSALCLVTYTINKAVAFIEIKMCVGTKPGNWLGKEKMEKACVLEAKKEKFKITHTEMWEDSSNLVRVKFQHNYINTFTERVPKSYGWFFYVFHQWLCYLGWRENLQVTSGKKRAKPQEICVKVPIPLAGVSAFAFSST